MQLGCIVQATDRCKDRVQSSLSIFNFPTLTFEEVFILSEIKESEGTFNFHVHFICAKLFGKS